MQQVIAWALGFASGNQIPWITFGIKGYLGDTLGYFQKKISWGYLMNIPIVNIGFGYPSPWLKQFVNILDLSFMISRQIINHGIFRNNQRWHWQTPQTRFAPPKQPQTLVDLADVASMWDIALWIIGTFIHWHKAIPHMKQWSIVGKFVEALNRL